jgi:uncharacterized protein (DUF1697 family)
VTAYAVLLRAVNLPSHQKVPMARLRQLGSDLGYDDVATYLQSGNLVLSSGRSALQVERDVRGALSAELGIDTAVMVRSRDDLRDIVDADVLGYLATDPAKRLVMFLAKQPTGAAVTALDPDEFGDERFEVRGREVTMWCPNGIGRSKLATAKWDRMLGVTGTARNWRTVTALLAQLDERS